MKEFDQIKKQLGLEINRNKCEVFSLKDTILEYIKGIKVVEKAKYLGLNISKTS